MAGRTLEEIEQQVWPEPDFQSGLVECCHRLRKKPLVEFTPADFRVMIGQKISLPVLVPRAVALLEADPLLDAYYYPGDLLCATVGNFAWLSGFPPLLSKVKALVERAMPLVEESDTAVRADLTRFLEQAVTPPPSTSARRRDRKQPRR